MIVRIMLCGLCDVFLYRELQKAKNNTHYWCLCTYKLYYMTFILESPMKINILKFNNLIIVLFSLGVGQYTEIAKEKSAEQECGMK